MSAILGKLRSRGPGVIFSSCFCYPVCKSKLTTQTVNLKHRSEIARFLLGSAGVNTPLIVCDHIETRLNLLCRLAGALLMRRLFHRHIVLNYRSRVVVFKPIKPSRNINKPIGLHNLINLTACKCLNVNWIIYLELYRIFGVVVSDNLWNLLVMGFTLVPFSYVNNILETERRPIWRHKKIMLNMIPS